MEKKMETVGIIGLYNHIKFYRGYMLGRPPHPVIVV